MVSNTPSSWKFKWVAVAASSSQHNRDCCFRRVSNVGYMNLFQTLLSVFWDNNFLAHLKGNKTTVTNETHPTITQTLLSNLMQADCRQWAARHIKSARMNTLLSSLVYDCVSKYGIIIERWDFLSDAKIIFRIVIAQANVDITRLGP